MCVAGGEPPSSHDGFSDLAASGSTPEEGPHHSGTAICAGVKPGLAAWPSITGAGTNPLPNQRSWMARPRYQGRPTNPGRSAPTRRADRSRSTHACAAIDVVSTRTPTPIVDDTASFFR